MSHQRAPWVPSLLVLGAITLLNNAAGANVVQLLYASLLIALTTWTTWAHVKILLTGKSASLPVILLLTVCALLLRSFEATRSIPTSSVISGSFPYFLFATCVMFGTASVGRYSASALEKLTAVAGVLEIVLITLQWGTRRGFISIPFATQGLASHYVILPWLGLSASRYLESRSSRHLLPLAAYLACSIVSGSRSGIALTVVPIAIVAAAARSTKLSRTRMAAQLVVLPGTAIALLMHWLSAQSGSFDNRLSVIRSSLSDPRSLALDESGAIRFRATLEAWQHVAAHPILGDGPGAALTYPVRLESGVTWFTGTNLDTTLMTPFKLGLPLTLALCVVSVSIAKCCRGQASALSCRMILASAVVAMPLASPFENAGFGVSCCLALLLSRPVMKSVPDQGRRGEDYVGPLDLSQSRP